jgi:hypothetical protein
MHDSKITELFDLLDKWRYFPAYQLERRADIFFAVFMKQIIHSKYNIAIDAIIPEFPVRVGAVHNIDINKSYKIDYLCVNQQARKVYLTELKTDVHSRRPKQDDYLTRAKEINISGLMDGLIKIYNATYQKSKYLNLLQEIEKLGWINMTGDVITNLHMKYDVEILYIQPEKHLDDTNEVITFDNVISVLRTNSDLLSHRFIQSLERWKVNPNEIVSHP